MKASELRIGNWVHDDINNLDRKVEAINENGLLKFLVKGCEKAIMIDWSHTSFSAVPLTEEWLVSFGFGLCEHRGYVKREFYICLFFDFYVDMASFRVKHIHQLQNLYHALTGEELEISK